MKMKIKFNLSKIRYIIHIVIGLIYFPIFVASWLLHKIARLLLSLSYFGMLEPYKGRNVIKWLFK
jgi:hypothetical protein